MEGADTPTLLQQFVSERSESAFAEIVRRHVDLVYSTAFRRVGRDEHLAKDVTQVVFTDLALKAPSLPAGVVLPGWLYRHTCFRASSIVRTEIRRRARERTAFAMDSFNVEEGNVSPNLESFVDEALSKLPDRDRDAVVLRYLAGKSLAEVGHAIGVTDDAAQKRISRALEQVRRQFARRGISTTATAISLALTQAVQAAPPIVAANAASIALAGALAVKSTPAVPFLSSLVMATHTKLLVLSAAAVAISFYAVSVHRENVALREQLSVAQQVPSKPSPATPQGKMNTGMPGAASSSSSPVKLASAAMEAELSEIIRDKIWRKDMPRFARFLESIAPGDFSRAMAIVMRDTTAASLEELRHDLVARWARSDPASAARWADNLAPGRERDGYRQMISEFWSESDPMAALQIAGPSQGAFRRLAQSSITTAADQAVKLPAGEIRQMAVWVVADTWFEKEPDAAVRWVGTLSNNADKAAALNGMLRQLTETSPVETARYLASLPEDPRFTDIARGFASQWAYVDAPAAAAWVTTLPAQSTVREATATAVIERWSNEDPRAAAQWLESLPSGEFRETAVTRFVPAAAHYDPALAGQLAQTISSETARLAAIEAVGRQWLQTDPTAARTWLAQVQFPLERMQAIEKR